jgi:replicative DNA helicase
MLNGNRNGYTRHASENGHNGHHPQVNKIDELPNTPESERAVLGSILVDSDCLIDLTSFLSPPDFYLERHSWIYQAMIDLFHKGQPVDLVLLSDLLESRGQLEESGGVSYLMSLLNQTPTSLHAEYYARLVERDGLRRRLLQAAGKIARLAYSSYEPDEMLSQAGKIVYSVASERVSDTTRPIASLTDEIQADIEQLSQAKGQKILGLPTGLRDLDKVLGGLQKSHLVVVAGRPGMGKSSLAAQVALHVGKRFKARSLIFSLEMSAKELTRRLISAESGIPEARIKTANIEGGSGSAPSTGPSTGSGGTSGRSFGPHVNEWAGYYSAIETISALPITIDDAGYLTPSQMRTRAMKLYLEQGLDLVILDYLQLMRGDGKYQNNRTQEVGDISRSCKLLARELNIPVMALSQLNRACEGRADKRPMLSDLRESGSIEADADEVIFIYRDELYNAQTLYPSVAELIIAKHRGGPMETISAFYNKQLTCFRDLDARATPLGRVD